MGTSSIEVGSSITEIIIPWGVYRFLSCSFGIFLVERISSQNSPIKYWIYLNWAIVKIDDAVVYGKMDFIFENVRYGYGKYGRVECHTQAQKIPFWHEISRVLESYIRRKRVNLSEERVQGI